MDPDVFVPVKLRWRHVLDGDVIVAGDGALWMVTACSSARGGLRVSARLGGTREFGRDVDPDDVTTVLISVVERDAVALTRDQLGARLVERRTGDSPPK